MNKAYLVVSLTLVTSLSAMEGAKDGTLQVVVKVVNDNPTARNWALLGTLTAAGGYALKQNWSTIATCVTTAGTAVSTFLGFKTYQATKQNERTLNAVSATTQNIEKTTNQTHAVVTDNVAPLVAQTATQVIQHKNDFDFFREDFKKIAEEEKTRSENILKIAKETHEELVAVHRDVNNNHHQILEEVRGLRKDIAAHKKKMAYKPTSRLRR